MSSYKDYQWMPRGSGPWKKEKPLTPEEIRKRNQIPKRVWRGSEPFGRDGYPTSSVKENLKEQITSKIERDNPFSYPEYNLDANNPDLQTRRINTSPYTLSSCTPKELQSILSQIINEQAQQEAKAKAAGKGKKKKKKKGGQPNPNPSTEPSKKPGKNFGNYNREDYKNEVATNAAREWLDKFLEKTKPKKVRNVAGVVPFYLQVPQKIFPTKKEIQKGDPVLLLRATLSSYMSDNMKDFVSSINNLARKEKTVEVFYYHNFNSHFLTRDGKKVKIEEITRKRRKILMPTCGCSGGGLNYEALKSLCSKNEVHLFTDYTHAQHNCGCGTFPFLEKETECEMHYSIVPRNSRSFGYDDFDYDDGW